MALKRNSKRGLLSKPEQRKCILKKSFILVFIVLASTRYVSLRKLSQEVPRTLSIAPQMQTSYVRIGQVIRRRRCLSAEIPFRYDRLTEEADALTYV